MPSVIPLEAIDPDAQHRKWRKQFEWHLDQIPPLMETMGMLRLPSLQASRLDQVRVSGGGYVDNVPIQDGGVSVDAEHIWAMLVEYVKAVTAWLNVGVAVPFQPVLPPLARMGRDWTAPRVDADPLSARRMAFEAIAWLIDHADDIEPIGELDEFREQLFTEIRRTRGRYRSAGTARRARPRVCGVCGECAVLVDWVTLANGSPKPIQVGRCKVCGATFAPGRNEGEDDAVQGS